VSDGVHRCASYVGSATDVSLSAGLAELDILMVGIAQPANCRPALLANHPHFTTWQNDGDPVAFFSHNFCGVSGTSNQLSALSGCHFDIMDFDAFSHRRRSAAEI